MKRSTLRPVILRAKKEAPFNSRILRINLYLLGKRILIQRPKKNNPAPARKVRATNVHNNTEWFSPRGVLPNINNARTPKSILTKNWVKLEI
jgi:hypothetical protein